MSKYWFRKRQGLFSKDLGWGWVPISWEGWLVIIGCIGLILVASVSFDLFSGKTTFFQGVGFGVVVIGAVSLAAWISSLKVKP